MNKTVTPAGAGPVDGTVRPEPERAAFEEWRLSCAPGLDMSRNMPGREYNNPHTHYQWQAWQAAVAAERERCAQWLDAYDGKGMRRAEAIRNAEHATKA